jgi:hypothetical protein
MAVIGSIALGLAGAWLRSEIAVWHDPLIKWLIRCAAQRMPEEFRIETEAELLAWINDIRSPTGKLVQAAHLFVRSGLAARAVQPKDRLLTQKLNGMLYAVGVTGLSVVAFGLFRRPEFDWFYLFATCWFVFMLVVPRLSRRLTIWLDHRSQSRATPPR